MFSIEWNLYILLGYKDGRRREYKLNENEYGVKNNFKGLYWMCKSKRDNFLKLKCIHPFNGCFAFIIIENGAYVCLGENCLR